MENQMPKRMILFLHQKRRIVMNLLLIFLMGMILKSERRVLLCLEGKNFIRPHIVYQHCSSSSSSGGGNSGSTSSSSSSSSSSNLLIVFTLLFTYPSYYRQMQRLNIARALIRDPKVIY